jgi:beta-phosphoglucomutase-like phosphatase (HAD superfamily)
VDLGNCGRRRGRRSMRMIARCFELIIFDCDGVLVDSESIINQAHAHVLTACGYPMTEHDLVERFCGMSGCRLSRVAPPC